MNHQLYGVYRGVVRGVEDPERLGRYKVLVHGIHQAGSGPDDLPWAELFAFGGRGFGDIPPYAVNDLVAVMFEQGDPGLPCILGGWISRRGGLNDRVPENLGPPESRDRWVRADRAGNKVELSEIPRERHVKVASGRASVTTTQNDDSVRVDAAGHVQITTPELAHIGSRSVHLVTDYSVSAVGKGDAPGRVAFSADGVVEIIADKKVVLGYAEIPGSVTPRVTEQTTLLGRAVKIGRDSPQMRYPSLSVEIFAKNEVHVQSETRVRLSAPRVDIVSNTETVVRAGSVVIEADSILYRTGRFDVRAK